MAAFEELLPASYACYAPDLPGHGEAEKLTESLPNLPMAAVLAILDTLGIRRAHIVGWSLAGGQTALQFALTQPDRCLSLSLISSNAPFYPNLAAMQTHFSRLSEAIRRGNYEAVGQLIRSTYYREGRFPLNGSPPANALFFYLLQSVMQLDGLPDLLVQPAPISPAELSLPLLMVHGDADLLISASEYKQADQFWPTDRLTKVVFEGASHTPMVEQPRRFALVLDEFLSHL